MNIRPRPGKLDLTVTVFPNSGPFRKSLFLAPGMFVPAPDDARPWPSQGTPELCPSTSVAETTSPLPSLPMTAPTRTRSYRATPHDCWPSCFPLRMCANEARRPLPRKVSAETGFLRCCGAFVEAGFLLAKQAGYGSACPIRYRLCTCRRGCSNEEPAARRSSVPGRSVPLDRNAKARIMAYARVWGARHRQSGQHRGPITRAFLEVLEALLWGFHNSRDGRCFPSYETIAAKAECARSTVTEALKVLEWAGVLTWVHRIARIQVREGEVFGRWASRWRMIRMSNAYVFRDPGPRVAGVSASKSGKPVGNTEPRDSMALSGTPPDPDSPLERALQHLGGVIEGRLLSNKGSGQALTT